MGKRVDIREKIGQLAVTFHRRQIDFIEKYERDPEARLNKNVMFRKLLDDQIKVIDPEYLSDKEKIKMGLMKEEDYNGEAPLD